MALQHMQELLQAIHNKVLFNSTTSSPTPTLPTTAISSVAATASSIEILSSNIGRTGFAVYNNGSTDLYLIYGAGPASTSSFTVKVPTNGLYEAPAGWAGLAMQGIWAGSPTGSAQVTEVL